VRRQQDRERHDGGQVGDLPAPGGGGTEIDHPADQGQDAGVHPLEIAEDLGYLLEEVRVVLFLGGGAPLHVDAEHVREDRQVEVEGQAAEEDREQAQPFEVLEERRQKAFLSQAVPHDREADVAQPGEDNQETQEDCRGIQWLVEALIAKRQCRIVDVPFQDCV
jgi:hypothetical protein